MNKLDMAINLKPILFSLLSIIHLNISLSIFFSLQARLVVILWKRSSKDLLAELDP